MKLLREDKKYKVIKKACKDADKDVDAWMNELFSMHTARGIRALNSSAVLASAQRTVIDTGLDNQTIRSRAVEINMRALRQKLFVSEKLDMLRRYLLAQYSQDLAEEYKTLTDRKNAVDSVLSGLHTTVKRLEGAEKIANLLVEDCDAAGYTLQRITEVLKMKSVDK